MKKLLVQIAVTVLVAGVYGQIARKAGQTSARNEGLVKGCQDVVNNTIDLNPAFSGTCSMQGDLLVISMDSAAGHIGNFDAATGKLAPPAK